MLYLNSESENTCIYKNDPKSYKEVNQIDPKLIHILDFISNIN